MRRFKSAQEVAKEEAEGRRPVGGFDTNAITPGTRFMARLCQHLREWAKSAVTNEETSFVVKKMS